MEYAHHLLWLFPTLFAAGFVDAIAGGGGLISMPAYMLCGMPIHLVYGCNKFQCAFGSTAAVYKYLKSGCIDVKLTAVGAVGSFFCSLLGTRLILWLSEEQIRAMLMVLLPCSALLVIFTKNAWSYSERALPLTAKNCAAALLIGMCLGLYDSVYGPGSATITLLLFTLLLHYDMRTSSGNTKLMLTVSNYTALVSYILSGNVLYVIAVPCAIANIAGNYLGAGFAVKKGAEIIRPVMIAVVAAVILKVLLGN